VADNWNIPLITEVARAVLSEMEASLASLRTDIKMVSDYQYAIFERQIEAEHKQGGSFVSDRAFDNLAYAAEHSLVTNTLYSTNAFRDYVDWVREGTVFFLRPHRSLLREDGVRETPTWDGVVRIDGMVKLLLEINRIPYLPIESSSMQERVRVVEFALKNGK
jgi:hypothetical protein